MHSHIRQYIYIYVCIMFESILPYISQCHKGAATGASARRQRARTVVHKMSRTAVGQVLCRIVSKGVAKGFTKATAHDIIVHHTKVWKWDINEHVYIYIYMYIYKKTFMHPHIRQYIYIYMYYVWINSSIYFPMPQRRRLWGQRSAPARADSCA